MRIACGLALFALGASGCYSGFKLVTTENPPPDTGTDVGDTGFVDTAPPDTGVAPTDTGTPPVDVCPMTLCGGACVDTMSDAAHCGACGVVCPAVSGGRAVCMAGRCQRVCSEGQTVCGDRCVDTAADPANCGGCGLACPTVLMARAVCRSGVCGVECTPGYHRCGDRCAENNAVATCGTTCTPCPAPTNGVATCDGLSCGFTCATGFGRCGSACVADQAPRLVAPLSTSTVTSRRPTLRLSLPAGSDGARVQLCRDRACATVVQTFEVVGASVAPTAALDPGVYFWRAFRRSGGCVGEAASATWQFTVHRRPVAMAAQADTSWGSTPDFEGDAFGDVVVGAPTTESGAGRVYVYGGAMPVLGTSPRTTLEAPDGGEFGAAAASVGDLDGDGYGDLAVGAPGVAGGAGRVYVFPGGATGLDRARVLVLRAPEGGRFGHALAGVGDLNGDGYGDLAVGAPEVSGAGRVYVYLGRAVGLASTPSASLAAPAGGRFGATVVGAGDLNGDGLGDLAVGAPGASSGAGRVHVYHGDTSGFASSPTLTLSVADESAFGTSLAGACDHNGDGYSDLAVGAPASNMEAGRVFVYRGGRTGLDVASQVTLAGAEGARFGEALASSGDTDGDGYDDLAIGAPSTSLGTGRVVVFSGGATGLGATARSTVNAPDGGRFGAALALSADVERDGFADLVVGAPEAGGAGGGVRGGAYLFRGSAMGTGAVPSPSLVPPATGGFGRVVACGRSQGRPRTTARRSPG